MQRKLIGLAVVVLLILGGVYYYFAGKQYVYQFTEAQLQEKLSAKLPLSRRYLFIFEVTLDHPRVALTDGSDRVAAGLDVILNIYVNESPVPLGGALDVSGSVSYDPEQGAFFLVDPVIERLQVQGIPDQYTNKVSQVLAKALGDYYQTRPIYTLTATNVKLAAARPVLKDVEVRDQTLIVTIGI